MTRLLTVFFAWIAIYVAVSADISAHCRSGADDDIDPWTIHSSPRPNCRLEAAATRMQHNKLGVALAYKLARIAWSVLSSGKGFDWKEKELATTI